MPSEKYILHIRYIYSEVLYFIFISFLSFLIILNAVRLSVNANETYKSIWKRLKYTMFDLRAKDLKFQFNELRK